MRSVSTCLLVITMLFFASCKMTTSEKEKSEKQTDVPEWEVLFDGKSVDQWRGYNRKTFPTKGWRVENELLIVEKSGTEEAGFGGDIITKKKYGDFALELDFMVSDTANSGILYLVQEVAETPIWHNAPEYQILDDPTYDEMYGDKMDTHRTADNYDLQKADKNYMSPVGEWNKARIVKKDNHVQHWLNDNLTVEYDVNSAEWKALVIKSKFSEYPNFAQAKEGHIGLQDHGHRVAFRNIRIKEL